MERQLIENETPWQPPSFGRASHGKRGIRRKKIKIHEEILNKIPRIWWDHGVTILPPVARHHQSPVELPLNGLFSALCCCMNLLCDFFSPIHAYVHPPSPLIAAESSFFTVSHQGTPGPHPAGQPLHWWASTKHTTLPHYALPHQIKPATKPTVSPFQQTPYFHHHPNLPNHTIMLT